MRLRGAGLIRADEVDLRRIRRDRGAQGHLAGRAQRRLKPAGVIHWVDAASALEAEFRLYDRLFSVPNPEGPNPDDILPDFDPEQPGHEDSAQPVSTDFLRFLNPESLKVTRGFVEGSVAADPPGTRYQFERQGYFWPDPEDSRPDAPVFNRIITLRDTWGKAETATKVRAEPKPARAEQKKAEAPELTPAQAAEVERLRGLGVAGAEAVVLARDSVLGGYFAGTTRQAPQVAAWVVNDLSAALRAGAVRLRVEDLPALADLLSSGEISSRIAKDVLTESVYSGEAPAELVARRGLKVMSDTAALETIIERVLAAHPAKLAEYRGGRTGLLGFFTGQVMRESGGQADPQAVARAAQGEVGRLRGNTGAWGPLARPRSSLPAVINVRLRLNQILIRRVALNVVGDKRATGNNLLALRPDIVQCELGELAAQPLTLVAVLNFGVVNFHRAWGVPVLGLADHLVAAEQFVLTFLGIVANVHAISLAVISTKRLA